MRNTIFRLVYGIAVFILTVFLLESLTTHESADVTAEMEPATFPVVTMMQDGTAVNELHGYTGKRDISLFHTCVTMIADDRTVTFEADPCGGEVAGLSFELRSITDDRLIENNPVRDTSADENGVIAGKVTLQNLIASDQEYMFILIVETGTGKELRYYTRLVEEDKDALKTIDRGIAFAQQFHDAALQGSNDSLLTQCLETGGGGESGADSEDLSLVDLYSPLDQVKYGTLGPEEILKPVISIRDIEGDVAMLRMHYILKAGDEQTPAYYDCMEWYRVRTGTDRVYLLNYRRTMDRIFDPKDTADFDSGLINLGITGSDLSLVESPGGTAFAFVNAGRLYGCIPGEQTISTIFAFGNPDSVDPREVNPDYGIRILDVDESGNVIFAVYGYMNRGRHEGELGTCIYSFNHEYRTVEEEAFLPCATSTELLQSQVEKLSYYSKSGNLYLLMGESVVSVNLASRTVSTVQDGLTDVAFQVSESGQMFACGSGKTDRYGNASEIELMNFAGRTQNTIKAQSGEKLRPLGFIGEDFLYGTVREADIVTDASGDVVTPMYEVCIVDSSLKVLEKYQMAGYYITGCTVSGNQVTLERVRKDEETGQLVVADADQIMGSGAAEQGANQLVAAGDETLGTVRQIAARGFSGKNIRYIEPKMVLFEGSRELELPEEKETEEQYFVYDVYGVTGYIPDPARAVKLADEAGGCVVDETGAYIWKKSGRLSTNQIMAIEPVADSGDGSIAACLDAIFRFESASGDSAALLAQNGGSVVDVLNRTIPGGRAFSLTGCSLDAVLYYVSVEKPVLVLYNDFQDAQLIVGCNDSIVVMMDPKSGALNRVSRETAEKQFTGSGCSFVAYLTEQGQ